MELIGLGLLVLGLVIVGIAYHAEINGIGFFYPAKEKFNIGGWQEQDRANRHAHFLKVEKKFWNNEIKILTLEKYRVRRAGDSLVLAVIKNAIFHSKKKMSAVRPHTARKLSAGRRKNDGKSGLLDWGIAIGGIAFLIIAVSTPITAGSPQRVKTETITVVKYTEPKTAEQIAEIQRELSGHKPKSTPPLITTAESQKVLRKSDKAKYDAQPTTTIELY